MDKLKYIIKEDDTILQALARLEEVEAKALFIVKKNKLIASLTDGDVRRAILRGVLLTSKVKEIAYYSPCYIREGEDELGHRLLREKKLQAIPIVNDQFEIVGICKADETRNKGKDIVPVLPNPVVIMAGGLGTRLYPYTKILPKALVPIADVPISERIIDSFQINGCQEFYMIVNHKGNMIKTYFNDNDKKYNIHFCDEEKPLGTGGGIRLLKDKIESTFILTNCDILILDDVRKMIEHHKEKGNIATMVCSLKKFVIPYGVVNLEDGKVNALEEKPEMFFWVNTGCYVLETKIFDYISENENIDMPDIIERMKNDNQQIGIYPIGENTWLDMGQMDSMERMEQKIRELNSL